MFLGIKFSIVDVYGNIWGYKVVYGEKNFCG